MNWNAEVSHATTIIYMYTLPQKKHNFSFQNVPGDPGPASVTPGHVHQGKMKGSGTLCKDFAIDAGTVLQMFSITLAYRHAS